ncbi:MAG: prepilin-type N-terminal cleavage/methylation domain-containing protein, partial [Verrucomicrobiae bacterium]|nr:prepilin-type N-terminal cleavage/methylation domain-containing protein [Verrucomicrobiae bacterium]
RTSFATPLRFNPRQAIPTAALSQRILPSAATGDRRDETHSSCNPVAEYSSALIALPVGVSCRRRSTNSGFTLIELIISTALIAVILGGAYACLNAGISSQKIVEPRTEVLQTARVALSLMSADLRGATSLPKGAPFLGTRRLLGDVSADVLDFATHNYTPRRPGEGDFCELSVFVDRDPQTGRLTLYRRRNPHLAFDPLSGGVREELATGVAGLRLEYYDGWDWYDSWGNPQAGSLKSEISTPKPNEIGLPDAVRITLMLESNPSTVRAEMEAAEPKEPSLTFQTIVKIAVPRSSSSSSSSASTSAADPSSPIPDNP